MSEPISPHNHRPREHGRERDGAAILLFLLLTLLLSSIFYALIIRAGHLSAGNHHYGEALMWMPAIAAFLTVAIRRLDINSLGISTFGGGFAVLGYVTPLAYAAIAYALVWTFGFGAFPDPSAIAKMAARLGWQLSDPTMFTFLYFLLIGSTGMIDGVARALGEEIGWRGFLAPRLVEQMGFTGGVVVTGLIWAAWHMPILLYADYNSGTPWWFALSCFTVMVVAMSTVMTWIRLRSNSVWPCAIFHASHNLFIQGFFSPLTAPRGRWTLYAVDEFGVGVPAVAVVFAIVFWSFRGRAGRR
jgi:uncharacterized protein